ncbi:solute carrier family 51 subunit beta [Syngnathoides biaculeatus]|uniref:solute carrier family 51 subunit beta n=1 Tax=Syngnathoides biaculeatus TaxID=300417 RepID=UPI002ADD3BBB|nr:solute carrier family 51 subunit beta [Syngnathoides biaculeatus]
MQHFGMFGGCCVLLFVFLSGGGAFLVRHPSSDKCLEERRYPRGSPVLRACRPFSRAQQWAWKGRGLLASELTSMCLAVGWPSATLPCHPRAELQWGCDRDTLIARSSPMAPPVDWWRLAPSRPDAHDGGEEGGEGNLCKPDNFRLRRASPDDKRPSAEGGDEKKAAVTDQQKEYLRWFYRTEDPTVWKFALLGLAFVCLLVGFLLLGMGAMASRNRRKIAKYKAAAAAQKGEDRTWAAGDDDCARAPPPATPCNGDMKAGSIVVTWKDGNTSCLYNDDPDRAEVEAEVELPQPSEGEKARVQREDEDGEEEEEMKDGRDTTQLAAMST